ncbi:tetratricopeptide repeat protein [Fulvivirga sp. M361]|uniref:tetratricopeptide repeat protein n=1 Tax=Fulvivirga sp. M361 TaxID=2594266 RepID=UPI00117B50AB|nr:tetratricopeptide repeat protein [Fulvivirga sp. M361]TRX62176.1 tetratricopeptide repeat protein [Fulvivirga sp. M361]
MFIKYLWLFLCLITFNGFTFQNIDSLENRLSSAKGKDRVDILNKIYIGYVQESPTKALSYSKDALDLASVINYPKGRAAALNNIGIVYKNQGVYDKALDYYIESIRISAELEDRMLLASTMNNIGTVYSLKETYDKALIYFIESYETFEKLGRRKQIIGALNNIGNAYSDMGEKKKAMEYYNKSIALAEETGDLLNFDPINNLGNIYFHEGDYPQALNYYEKSKEIAEASNDFRGRAYAMANIGSAYLELNDYDRAESHFNQAIQIATDLKENPILKQIYLGLSTIAFNKKKYKEAYEARLLYDKVKDYVYNEESSRKLARLEMAFEFQQKEKELEILKRTKEITDLKLENNRIVILLGIMGTIILVAIGFILFKLKRAKIA